MNVVVVFKRKINGCLRKIEFYLITNYICKRGHLPYCLDHLYEQRAPPYYEAPPYVKDDIYSIVYIP